jgi:N-acyl-D-amino-acid deacylase
MLTFRRHLIPWLPLFAFLVSCSSPPEHQLVLKGGTIYDGSGGAPYVGDLAIDGDTISAVLAYAGGGEEDGLRGILEIDVSGKAVSPGFINMLSWANESLLEDGRGESDLVQGVTLVVMGEGWSMGPLNNAMKAEMLEDQGDIAFDVEWTSLDGYLQHLVERGVSPNVASFVGATTVRIHELSYEDRAPSAEELERMKGLVRTAMQEGALGLASSLIYAPAFYADTEELIALAAAAGEYGGMYISHIRSEGNSIFEAVDELIGIAREAGVAAEIYHLKAAGASNWPKLDGVIDRVEAARAEGLRITADMYTYTAGATGLDAAMPPWVQEGGDQAWIARLEDPAIRRQVTREMRTPTDEWESLYLAAGSADNVILVGFRTDELKPLTGKTLAQVAEERGVTPEDAAIDLLIANGADVNTVYFLMSEENVKKKIALPWISFGSDAEALSPSGVFLESNPHPRAYGNFARLLGRYVRDEGVIPLEEAVRKLTTQPAAHLGVQGRGALTPGYFADVVVFDPAAVQDRATFAEPHQLAEGVVHVFVNGTHTVRDGAHTGALAGRVVRGPGWTGD